MTLIPAPPTASPGAPRSEPEIMLGDEVEDKEKASKQYRLENLKFNLEDKGTDFPQRFVRMSAALHTILLAG